MRTQAESYRVIEGDFEYYAALQAMEIEPRQRNRINAYIVESEEELPFYQKQIEVFRKQSVAIPVEKPVEKTGESESVEKTGESEKEPAIPTQANTVDIQPIMNMMKNWSEQVAGFISQQSKRDADLSEQVAGFISQQSKRNADLSEQVAGFISQQSKRDAEVDKKFNILQEAIANISVAPPPETKIISQPEKPTVDAPVLVTSPFIPKSPDFVADFNNKGISDSEFEMKLNRIGITARFTRLILAERGQRTFNSFTDFKIKGIGKETIKKIRHNWS
ncbi:MAG: hypothetical protein KAI83_13690 [Thiomargarita sp.]|nr:hypothetical protein [Thiomargarita sp.]